MSSNIVSRLIDHDIQKLEEAINSLENYNAKHGY